jgi:hypothetical protein
LPPRGSVAGAFLGLAKVAADRETHPRQAARHDRAAT